MIEANKLYYLRQKEIDKAKWDRCIAQAGNGLVYGYSFYLDHMAGNWDGIVCGDYQAVMPLPWNKKFGIRYIYQPFLTAQGGVFGGNLQGITAQDFIDHIPVHFRFIDMSLNPSAANDLTLPFLPRKNFVLPLFRSYDELSSAYSENTQRNIKKAVSLGIQKEFDVEEVIRLAVGQMKSRGEEEKQNIDRFRKLYKYLHERQMAISYGVFSGQTLLASCVFFFSHNRAYYILVGNDPAGKNTGASHALIDAFIKDHAGKNIVLDFEGSDIESLARFYSGFGALVEIYPAIKINRLPFFLKWLKK